MADEGLGMGTGVGEGSLPRRRLRMELTMDADSLGDVCGALRRIADTLEHDAREEVDHASGRRHAGHGVSLHITDPAMDGGRYRAAAQLWRSTRER